MPPWSPRGDLFGESDMNSKHNHQRVPTFGLVKIASIMVLFLIYLDVLVFNLPWCTKVVALLLEPSNLLCPCGKCKRQIDNGGKGSEFRI